MSKDLGDATTWLDIPSTGAVWWFLVFIQLLFGGFSILYEAAFRTGGAGSAFSGIVIILLTVIPVAVVGVNSFGRGRSFAQEARSFTIGGLIAFVSTITFGLIGNATSSPALSGFGESFARNRFASGFQAQIPSDQFWYLINPVSAFGEELTFSLLWFVLAFPVAYYIVGKRKTPAALLAAGTSFVAFLPIHDLTAPIGVLIMLSLFRVILNAAVYTELVGTDVWQGVWTGIAFACGYHLFNNMGTWGYMNSISAMTGTLPNAVFGLFLAVTFVAAIYDTAQRFV